MRAKKPAAQRYLSLLADPVPTGETPLAIRRGTQRREGIEHLAAPIIEAPAVQDEIVIRRRATSRARPPSAAPTEHQATTLPPRDSLPLPASFSQARLPVSLPVGVSETVADQHVRATGETPLPSQRTVTTADAVETTKPFRYQPEPQPAQPAVQPTPSQPTPIHPPVVQPAQVESRAPEDGRILSEALEERVMPTATEVAGERTQPAIAKSSTPKSSQERFIEPLKSEFKTLPTEGIFRDRHQPQAASDSFRGTNAASATLVRIGTVEIRNAHAKPVPAQPMAPIHARASEGREARSGEPISRGLAWSYGLVQG